MKSPKGLDTVTEALIGAIFLDAPGSEENGFDTVRVFLEAKNLF